MNANEPYTPFSQRTGLVPVPPQLKLGEVSNEMRRLIDYSISKEIGRVEVSGYDHCYFDRKWIEVARDLHVKFFGQAVGSFENKSYTLKKQLERWVAGAPFGKLFDFVEFLVRHPGCSKSLKTDLESAFVDARAAYRMVDGQIIAIGTDEQAVAFERAVSAADVAGATAAKRHLVASGSALRRGDWADSVRESIHAVESVARTIEPDAQTLGPALKSLEKNGYIHGSLKSAFEKLYGYTNDEGGIRHALIDDVARVDEVDALFMLGACASFTSYLITRNSGRPSVQKDEKA